MTDRKNTVKAMKVTIGNAKRFLKDSKILQKNGSVGHATSLAILGYEEAHKAYLLAHFLPIFDGLTSEEYRRDLKSQIRDHQWKQLYAKEFRIGLEGLLVSGIMSEEERIDLGIPTLSELKAGTDFAFTKRLNQLKNDGFYSGSFRIPVWNPSDMKESVLKIIQSLLESQIRSVEYIVKILSILHLLPKAMIGSVKAQLKELIDTLGNAQTEGVTNLAEITKKLSKHGVAGKHLAGLVKHSAEDERLKEIDKEKFARTSHKKKKRSYK